MTVRIDSDPPVTTDDAKPWERGNVVIALTATDTVSGVAFTHYSLDGGSWLRGDVVHVSGDGPHVIKYRSIDRAGNQERVRTCSFSIDNGLPVTFAPEAVTVGQGYWTTLAFRVVDVTPKATVRIKVTGPQTKTYGPMLEPTNKLVTYRFRCKLPYGTYTYAVEATDLAGNAAVQIGNNALRKPAPVITVTASVDDRYPPRYSTVAASRVTEQYGNPVPGASVIFVDYMTVIDTVSGFTTDSYGDAANARYISGATAGYPVEIDVTAALGSQTATATTGFTPQ